MDERRGMPSKGFWYLVAGAVVGGAAGLLFAPRRGTETRAELDLWAGRNRERARSWMSTIGRVIPARVKAAAAVGAVKNGAAEATEMSKEAVGAAVDRG